MPNRQLQRLLDDEHVNYTNIKHSPEYTSERTAQSAHIPGKLMAKPVIIKMGDKFAMVVVCANDKVNFSRLEKELGKDHIDLATEREFQDRFPECETGAMPPFGNLYNMEVYVDEKLAQDDEIVFNAGTHTELVRMAYKDFERIVHPEIVHATKH